jgi:hypothetical protein
MDQFFASGVLSISLIEADSYVIDSYVIDACYIFSSLTHVRSP